MIALIKATKSQISVSVQSGSGLNSVQQLLNAGHLRLDGLVVEALLSFLRQIAHGTLRCLHLRCNARSHLLHPKHQQQLSRHMQLHHVQCMTCMHAICNQRLCISIVHYLHQCMTNIHATWNVFRFSNLKRRADLLSQSHMAVT